MAMRRRLYKFPKADLAWSKAVRERDGYRCQLCGRWYGPGSGRAVQGLHAAHIFSRNNLAVRHDLDNGVTLCYAHHRWAHENPVAFAEWVKRRLGEARYEALRRRAGASDPVVRAAMRQGRKAR
jgi:5-methylcytosine-specific restriction endonuclease McrA